MNSKKIVESEILESVAVVDSQEEPKEGKVKKANASKTDAKPKKTTKQKSDKKETPEKKDKKEKKEPKIKVFVEYNGAQVALDDVVKSIKSKNKDAKEIRVYLKPEDNAAYFVADEKQDSIKVYFC